MYNENETVYRVEGLYSSTNYNTMEDAIAGAIASLMDEYGVTEDDITVTIEGDDYAEVIYNFIDGMGNPDSDIYTIEVIEYEFIKGDYYTPDMWEEVW